MSSKYEVNRQVKNNYEMCLIKLENGQKCLYWNKKGTNDIKKIIVIFNNENVVNIKDDEICVSFDKVSSKEDFINLMVALGTELYKNKIDITKVEFKFIVDKKEEIDNVNDFISKYKLKGDFEYTEKYTQLTQNLDDAINNIAVSNKDSQIVKEDNNQINKYVVHDDKIYSDNDTLSINEQKKNLLDQRLKDEAKVNEMSKMSAQEVNDSLTKEVTSNKKEYLMEDSHESKEDSNFERVSNDVAREQDNKVNDELGIIKNSPSNEKSFSAVEKDGDKLSIVNPYVVQESITPNNFNNKNTNTNDVTSYSNSSYDRSFWDDDNELASLKENGKVENRGEVLPVYYVDNEEKLYNERGDMVGRNGVGGYLINEKNNLVLYGKVVGQIGDINEMDRSSSKENSNVRVYKPNRKSSYYNNNKKEDSGIVSLPVIIFIISLFLLIGSGIILYLMK